MDGSGARRRASSSNILSNYKLGRTLGIGTFGKVKLATHIPTEIKVAIKIIKRQSINDSNAERGVECCHLHMVVHRDLKPENLLLDSKRCNIKIADFGLSNIMSDGHFLKTSCGSPNYAAPEVISKKLYAGPEVDVWSCGVILYALLCGTLPFDDGSLPGLYAKIKNGVYTFPNYLSLAARDLISRILNVDPISRLSIPEICQHPWFQQRLPRYLLTPMFTAVYNTKSIDGELILEVAKMGFDVQKVVESLQNGLQNEATVAYYLLSDRRFSVHQNYLKNDLEDSLQHLVHEDRPEIYLRSLSPDQRKWALGFQSQANPRETMAAVLKIFQKLNVRWKEIGPYNMKCLWLLLFSSSPKDTRTDDLTNVNAKDGLELSITSTSRAGVMVQDAVKFEIQLYKASEESYLLDMQMIHGTPLLFLDICAAFFASVVT